MPSEKQGLPLHSFSDVKHPDGQSSLASSTQASAPRKLGLRSKLLRASLLLGTIYLFYSATSIDDNEWDLGNEVELNQDRSVKFGGRHGKHHHCKGKHGHGHIGRFKHLFEDHMQADVDRLVEGSLSTTLAWDRLAEMTDTYGNRMVGSAALEKSIDWIVDNVKSDGLSVSTEDVVVDWWERNEESLYFLSPTRGPVKLHMLGLGFSVPTPDPINGLEAQVVIAESKEELEELAAQGLVKGRVVLFNKKFTSYNTDYIYRTQGAKWAQQHGAVAALVRAVGPFSLQTAHTGTSSKADIPTAAVASEDADLLARSLKRHQADSVKFPEWPTIKLTMNAKTELASRTSRNIIVELKGRETPEEIVVVGGHIDSWDVGVGAVDDGAGCFIAWETLRQLSLLPQPPRRTVRAVFWTSEENGSPGGRVYAKNHPETKDSRHVFAFESDNGVFDPFGIMFTGGSNNSVSVKSFSKEMGVASSAEFMTAAGRYYLGRRDDLGYRGAGHHVLENGHGADIAPLCAKGVACAQFTPADPFARPVSEKLSKEDREADLRNSGRRAVDGGYFVFHHTEGDSMAAFTPAQVSQSAAVMAVWTYLAAEAKVEL